MKNLLLICALAFISYTNVQAQASLSNKPVGRGANQPKMPDETSTVKDLTGKVLPYDEWHALLIGGTHGLRSSSAKPGVFVLFKLSTKQLQDRAKYIAEQSTDQATQVSNTATQVTNIAAPVPVTTPPAVINYPPPNESGFFTNGQKPESFRAYDFEGKRVELKDLVGKIVVLNFWFIGCPPCRMEIPELNKIAGQYANDPDVVFVAIGLDKRSNIKDFIKENPFNYRLVANGFDQANIYGVNLYPTNVVIDKQGIVRFNASGYGPGTPYWIKKTIEESKNAN
jgi:thiol-disulfide isomerase/thioredoxin